jgi:hypothetical protein
MRVVITVLLGVTAGLVAMGHLGCSPTPSELPALEGGPQEVEAGKVVVTARWPEPSEESVSARLIPAASESILVELLAGSEVLATAVIPRPGGSVAFEAIPAAYITVRATARPRADGTGVPQAAGDKQVRVLDGQTVQVALVLGSTVESIDLSPTPIDLIAGEDLQVTATALNGAGEVVLVAPGAWQWLVANTDVAQVSSAGVLSGIFEGSTSLTVTETESGASSSRAVGVSWGTADGVVTINQGGVG